MSDSTPERGSGAYLVISFDDAFSDEMEETAIRAYPTREEAVEAARKLVADGTSVGASVILDDTSEDGTATDRFHMGADGLEHKRLID